MFIQYENNIHGKYVMSKDQNKQPIMINYEGKNIVLFEELKPFWRNLCEQKKDEDIQQLTQ